jgi:hypothetical protein
MIAKKFVVTAMTSELMNAMMEIKFQGMDAVSSVQ